MAVGGIDRLLAHPRVDGLVVLPMNIPPKGTYLRAFAEFNVECRRLARMMRRDLARDHGSLWLFAGMWLGFLILGIASFFGIR